MTQLSHVRFSRLAVTLMLVQAAACGGRSGTLSGDSGSPSDGKVTADKLTPAVCPAPEVVTTLAALTARIGALSYSSSGKYLSGRLPLSGDVQVKGTLSLDAAALKVPSSCTSYGCRPQLTFRIDELVSGVTCTKTESVAWLIGCQKLVIKDTVLRLRGVVEDTHPGTYNFVPVVDLIKRCSDPCKKTQISCPFDNTCFSEYDAYCRNCLAKDKKVCACEASSGPLAEGADCHFAVSGDAMCGGKCQQGTCKATNPSCEY